jgi:glucose-1-phosphate thymidylyltransferase
MNGKKPMVKLFIIYAGIEDREQEWPDGRSLPLQRLAGSNVLGHVLNQLWDAGVDELLVIVQDDQEAVAAWLAQEIPHLAAHVLAVPRGTSTLQALAGCSQMIGGERLIVAAGSRVVEADYESLAQSKAGLTIFTAPVNEETLPSWTGIVHFRRGADLSAALQHALSAGGTSLDDLLSSVQARGLPIDEQPATICLDTAATAGLLFTNARLLGLGYGSEDAIERSYVEDFTVLPPVFLHETAVIDSSVIGPFANIEAGAKISGSIIRSSLIGAESTIENAILDSSLIGRRARIKATGHALFIEDNKEIDLD